MSCWRVLDLSQQPDDEQIPQLLIKPVFQHDSYVVHLTDLSNIWSEELNLHGVVDRASQEQSPIEVSKQDTTQLAILLDNVKKPLDNSGDATCRITRNNADGLTLHTSVSLPEPFGRLTWKFQLEKRTSVTLKDELILPLLVSSHIQHQRITGLVSTMVEKDKAITRLVDQYESNNLDLAAAFPSIGGMKAGRKLVKREQAARHISALRSFREEVWKQETEQLQDSDVTTLGLFQEALAQNTPKVPPQLKSKNQENSWWAVVPTRLSPLTVDAKINVKKTAPAAKPKQMDAESTDDETEDEFEVHDNFKLRNIASKPIPAAEPNSSPMQNGTGEDGDSTEDEDDLDAPPKSQNQSQSRAPRRPSPPKKSPTPEPTPPPKVSTPPATKPKIKNFRIGGRARVPTESPEPLPEIKSTKPDADVLPTRESVPASSQPETQPNTTPKRVRKPFIIGGKSKAAGSDASQRATPALPSTNRVTTTQSPIAQPAPTLPPKSVVEKTIPAKEIHEETPEEKAERKRAELKRKNEEAARKQAQTKKKKRF